MELIYADRGGRWQGALLRYSLDLAFGSGENDFELKTPLQDAKDANGSLVIGEAFTVFAPGTEYGGVVDDVTLDTTGTTPEVKWHGRSWHGIMAGSVLRPDSGKSHLVVSGDCNEVIASLVARQGLGEVFRAAEPCGVSVSNYRFYRYENMYDGIRRMLTSAGMRLEIVKAIGPCELSAVSVKNLQNGIDENFVRYEMSRAYRPVNHLVCLGSGEGASRTVVDLFADADGNVGSVQTLFGIDEREEVYDYSSVKSAAELAEKGREKLRDMQGQGSVSLKLGDVEGPSVGDLVTAKSVELGMSVTARVTKLVVSVENGGAPSISYTVGSEEREKELA